MFLVAEEPYGLEMGSVTSVSASRNIASHSVVVLLVNSHGTSVGLGAD
jgi:hypothetical protein